MPGPKSTTGGDKLPKPPSPKPGEIEKPPRPKDLTKKNKSKKGSTQREWPEGTY